MSGGRGQFDRTLLPALVAYVETAGHQVVGRGRQRRSDCLMAEHSHKLTMTVDSERGLWYCFACDEGGDVLDLHRRRFDLGFLEAARDLGAMVEAGEVLAAMPKATGGDAQRTRYQTGTESPATLADIGIDKILAATRELAGTVGAEYLTGRGCALPPADGDLRFHPDLRRYGFSGPCLVGRITAAAGASETLGLHLTWIKRDGGLWRRSERRYMGRKAGGVIRLWADEAVTHGLAIAEGIETALAVARVFAPVWSCLDAGNLRAFPVLPGEVALSIFADRDASGAGQRAAADCAERWRDAGREVRAMAALRTGADMADIAAEVA